MSSVYTINKGMNRPIVFKGLKAQYIWYMGAGVMVLLIGYLILYLCHVNTFICLALIFIVGSILVGYIYRLSSTYGQYGMLKRIAKRSIPHAIKSYSRKEFIGLKR
jgi:hypothetical protein